ncbi:MAG: methyltransferase domain-containing protein [Pseudomonadota bacterium]
MASAWRVARSLAQEILETIMGLYSHYILPRVLDIACSNRAVAEVRQAIVPEAEGTVVEVGIGSGLNLPHYDPAKVGRVIGVDPDDQLWRRAGKRRSDRGFAIERLGSSAESIALDSDVADTVVVTFSLCSIPMVVEALVEMRRVLRPGGRLLFAEHGLAPDERVVRWQRRLDPIWGRIAGGCHLSRPILRLLQDAGWRLDRVDRSYLKGPKPMSYVYRGSAVPA